VPRYNLFPAAEVQGAALPGVSTGQAIAAMEEVLRTALPEGFGYEWTELACRSASPATPRRRLRPGGGVRLPGAGGDVRELAAAARRGADRADVGARRPAGRHARRPRQQRLVQVGLVVLVGLAAKNAILIVEFARAAEEAGRLAWEAAAAAARTRLRPILMTSLAFILGVLPLTAATGAGAEMRQSLGVAVFYGMLGVTLFGLLFTPVFYVVARALASRSSERRTKLEKAAEV
jgi:HAE1 family hydrophobic/amphiphilic exporter-1